MIHWEGICEATALHYPYILAFEPSFVEIYHVETGHLVQIIPGHNIRLLHEGRGKLGEGGEILVWIFVGFGLVTNRTRWHQMIR